MKEFLKKNWFGLVTAGLAFAILLITIISSGGLKSAVSTLADANPLWIAAGFGLIVVYWILDNCVLVALTREHAPIGFFAALKVTLIGFLYNALTPFAAGGQPMQIYMMSKEGVPAGDGASVITIKSLLYQTGMVAFAVFALLVAGTFFDGHIGDFELFVLFGFACNLIFIGFILFISFMKKLTKRIAICIITIGVKFKLIKNRTKALAGALRQIDLFHNAMKFVNKRKALLFSLLLLTMLQLCVFYAIPYMVYLAFGLKGDSLVIMVAANALICMITAFVPLPGASGAAEGGFYLFFKLFFPSRALVFSAILVWRLITYYSCIVVGFSVSLKNLLPKPKRIINN